MQGLCWIPASPLRVRWVWACVSAAACGPGPCLPLRRGNPLLEEEEVPTAASQGPLPLLRFLLGFLLWRTAGAPLTTSRSPPCGKHSPRVCDAAPRASGAAETAWSDLGWWVVGGEFSQPSSFFPWSCGRNQAAEEEGGQAIRASAVTEPWVTHPAGAQGHPCGLPRSWCL